MTKDVKYDVLREHEGDKFYREGDTRDLKATDAAALIALGVLAEHDPDRFAATQDGFAQAAIRAVISGHDKGLQGGQEESAGKFIVGEKTMAHVFQPSGLTDLHDLQAVLDAVENALSQWERVAEMIDRPGGFAALDADLQKARSSAEQQISEINAGVSKAQERANNLIKEENERLENLRSSNADAMAALEDDLSRARTTAENETLKINGEVSAARDAATAEITKINADLAGKKAEVEVANKAEKPLKNKAE